MHGFELSMYLIETNMSESIEFKINHVHDWNEYVWIHWVWMVLKGKGFLILEIKGRTLSIVIEYGGVSKKGCLWVPQAFLFLVQKARLGAPHFETIPYAGFGILNQLGSKLLENLSFQRVKGTCREKLCGSPPCPAWWPGALLLWSQLHTHRKSSPRHPTLQVKVCALLSDWDVPFWFCNEIGETPKSKTFSAKPQSRSAWPWSGLRNLAGLRSTTISASSKAPSLEPTGSIWTGEDGWLSGPCLLRLSLWWDQAPPWCGPHPSATCSASHLFGEILWSPSSTDPRLTSLCCAHLALIGHPWRSKSEGPSATCWGAAAPPPWRITSYWWILFPQHRGSSEPWHWQHMSLWNSMCKKTHIDRTCHCRTLARCFKQNLSHLSQAARTGTSQALSRAAKKGSSCCCPSGVAGSKSLASNIVNRMHWIFVKPFTMSMLKGLTSTFCPLSQDIWSKYWINKHESTYWHVTAWSSIQSWGHLDLVAKWVLIWNLHLKLL